MGESLRSFGVDVVLCVAGLVGSLIAVGRNSATNVRGTVVCLAAGVGSANYLTPLVVDHIGGESNPKWSTGLAFVLGTLGLRVMEIVNNKVDAEIAKRFPSPPSQEGSSDG